jgi:RNA polymerase sigma-70 factor (ECF subfamily)
VKDPDIEFVWRVITKDDRHAFGELVKRHQSGVRNLMRRLTKGDESRADD